MWIISKDKMILVYCILPTKSYIDNQNIPDTMYTDKHGHKLDPQPLILFWKSHIVMLKHVKWEVSHCHRTGNMFFIFFF